MATLDRKGLDLFDLGFQAELHALNLVAKSLSFEPLYQTSGD
jgi:hypothetical protein